MDTVNENSTAYISVTFYDKDEIAAQPSSATYDLVDENTGDVLRDNVTLSPTGGIVEITLTKADNVIIDATRTFEHRRLTVHGVYGADDEIHSEYVYEVENLHEVPIT